MGLRDKYAYAIQTAKDLRMQGSADEREGKLYFHGTVNSQAEANKIDLGLAWRAMTGGAPLLCPDWAITWAGDRVVGGRGCAADSRPTSAPSAWATCATSRTSWAR